MPLAVYSLGTLLEARRTQNAAMRVPRGIDVSVTRRRSVHLHICMECRSCAQLPRTCGQPRTPGIPTRSIPIRIALGVVLDFSPAARPRPHPPLRASGCITADRVCTPSEFSAARSVALLHIRTRAQRRGVYVWCGTNIARLSLSVRSILFYRPSQSTPSSTPSLRVSALAILLVQVVLGGM